MLVFITQITDNKEKKVRLRYTFNFLKVNVYLSTLYTVEDP